MRKRWLRRILLILLAALMLCALMFPASGSSSVYFMAVNDTVKPEITADNMPRVVNSTLYVPYTMFSSQVTGINLGVRAQYNASRNILTVTDGQKTVIFDTRHNTSYDDNGKAVSAQALVRNSMAYLPIHWLCNYFPTVRYNLVKTPYGTLIRVTNNAVVLNDTQFVDAAADMLYDNLIRYQNSLTEPDPSPSPTTTTAPPPSTPSPPPTTEPTPTPEVCLAFRAGDYTAEAADILEDAGQRGLFLFTSGELIRQDDLVRRLVASGHQVGLALTGSDLNACLTQLTAGQQLLADIARTPVYIVSADELSDEDLHSLAEAGRAVWHATHTDDEIPSNALQRQLHPTEMNYLEYTCDKDGLTLLRQTIHSLTSEDFILHRALAPAL